jgi:hypothetical protein
MSDLTSIYIISTKHNQIYLSISKNLASKDINTSTHLTKQSNTAYMWFTPTLGLCPPTLLLYYLRSSFLQAHSIKILLRRRQEIYAHFARSSFFELGYSTKPSYNYLHIALQVSHSMHKASTIHT